MTAAAVVVLGDNAFGLRPGLAAFVDGASKGLVLGAGAASWLRR